MAEADSTAMAILSWAMASGFEAKSALSATIIAFIMMNQYYVYILRII
jgi:hypothetical protein